jgi:ubiquitin-protein ligase
MAMDIRRIRSEVIQAATQFAFVEAHPTNDGEVYVKSALQTSAGKTYFLAIHFSDYPNCMPKVFVTNPTLRPTGNNHMYTEGHICYLHPNMWNPGRHTLTFVLGRVAKWLNKYDCWLVNGGHWPGAEVKH